MEEITNIVRQAFAGMALTGADIFNIFFSLLLAFLTRPGDFASLQDHPSRGQLWN